MTYQQVKIVLLGNSGVGKTSILNRFIADDFRTEEESTVGAAFMGKIVDYEGSPVKLNIWDTAGQERYQSLAKLYYRDADAAILVYDITKKRSFETLSNWVNELQNNGPSSLLKIIVGNKEDLVNREKVSPEEAFVYASSIGAYFKKTSAKSSYGVNEIFETVLENVTIRQRSYSKVKLPKSRTQSRKKKCCEMENSRKAVDVPFIVREINSEGLQIKLKPEKEVFPYIENCSTKPSFPLYHRHGVTPVHDHKETYKEMIFDFKSRRIVPKEKNSDRIPLDLTIKQRNVELFTRSSELPRMTKAEGFYSPRPNVRNLKKRLYEYDFYEDRFSVGEKRPVVICVAKRQKRGL